jgi:type IV secretion system protein VirD4
MHPTGEGQIFALIVIATIVTVFVLSRRRWRGSGTAYGTANWMTDKMLDAAGMLAGDGLIVGRTFKGALIRLADYCHVLLCGTPGSGKGVSIIIPNLLSYFRGSIVAFDTKGDLYETTAKHRAAKGQRIIRLAPFAGGTDALNPLDAIPSDSPMLVDSARALAESLVVRQGTENDPHWNDKAVQVICAALVLVLLKFKKEDRTLSSVQAIVSDPDLLKGASGMLQGMGGIPGRLGTQLKSLFENGTTAFTREGASVLSCVTRHLSFLDSDLVAKAIETSTFDPEELRKPGITLYLQIPPGQLDAQKGLLRCWVSTLVRVIGAVGNEWEGETLFMLDEASALGSLPAIEEAMVRGRSAGVRLLLAYQSDSQISTAFRDKPSLIYDNCNVQIYLGASSYETAERLSKSLGDWTQVVESYDESESWDAVGGSEPGKLSRSRSMNYSEAGRALLRPEEILTLDNDCVIILQRGMSPLLAQRVKWYQDPEFNPATAGRVTAARMWWSDLFTPLWRQPSRASVQVRLVLAAILGLILLAMAYQANH